MFNKILFCNLLLISSLIFSGPSLNAKSWENCKVPSDSIIAAINRGDTITIEECEVVGTLELRGGLQKPFIIKNPIKVFGCVFDDSVFFSCCTFQSEIEFIFSIFRNVTVFTGVTFKESSTFGGCVFDDYFSFFVCWFNKFTSVEASSFNKIALFIADTLQANSNFSQCTFRDNANFLSLYYGGNVTFSESAFEEDVSFANTKFNGNINLTSVKFNKITILWKQIKDHLICDNLTCSKLMKHFDEQRMLDAVDGAYFFLKDQERMEKPWYFRYPEFWFIQLTCGYGVKPGYTLLWSLGIIILFAFFYTLRFNSIKEIEKELRYPKRPKVPREVRGRFRKRLYDAFYFSVHTFIIGVVSDWHPTDEFLIKTKRVRLFKFRTLSMIEGVLGWVLLVLFVVTLTRKFIR